MVVCNHHEWKGPRPHTYVPLGPPFGSKPMVIAFWSMLQKPVFCAQLGRLPSGKKCVYFVKLKLFSWMERVGPTGRIWEGCSMGPKPSCMTVVLAIVPK